MNKAIFSTFLVLALIFSTMAVYALPLPIKDTLVNGIVYKNNDITQAVSDVDVAVYCTHNGIITNHNTTTNNEGEYSVLFNSNKCEFNDDVYVHAEKGSLYGDNTGKITINNIGGVLLKLDIGIINVPLIPEFGLIAGAVTVIASITIFFVVRRK